MIARAADVATWKDFAYLTAHFPLAVLDLLAVRASCSASRSR